MTTNIRDFDVLFASGAFNLSHEVFVSEPI